MGNLIFKDSLESLWRYTYIYIYIYIYTHIYIVVKLEGYSKNAFRSTVYNEGT